MDANEVMMAEWEKWREVCRQLEKVGAVTKADGERPISHAATTPGAILYQLLREWGDLRALQGATKAESV